MSLAGKIRPIGCGDTSDLTIREFTINLPSAFYYRYYYGYSLQAVVGEEISS